VGVLGWVPPQVTPNPRALHLLQEEMQLFLQLLQEQDHQEQEQEQDQDHQEQDHQEHQEQDH
jgi:hypothetical protein